MSADRGSTDFMYFRNTNNGLRGSKSVRCKSRYWSYGADRYSCLFFSAWRRKVDPSLKQLDILGNEVFRSFFLLRSVASLEQKCYELRMNEEKQSEWALMPCQDDWLDFTCCMSNLLARLLASCAYVARTNSWAHPSPPSCINCRCVCSYVSCGGIGNRIVGWANECMHSRFCISQKYQWTFGISSFVLFSPSGLLDIM